VNTFNVDSKRKHICIKATDTISMSIEVAANPGIAPAPSSSKVGTATNYCISRAASADLFSLAVFASRWLASSLFLVF
jgi:hypothetical protein